METACGLAEEVVRTHGEVRLRVFGTSMAPAMLPGDLVTIRRTTLGEVSTGDVVLFLQNGRLFVHRVVGAEMNRAPDRSLQPRLITRGDRLQHDDAPIGSKELLGHVVSIERNHRQVELDTREPNSLFARLLRASDRLTYLYVRLIARWRSFFFRGVKCRV